MEYFEKVYVNTGEIPDEYDRTYFAYDKYAGEVSMEFTRTSENYWKENIVWYLKPVL